MSDVATILIGALIGNLVFLIIYLGFVFLYVHRKNRTSHDQHHHYHRR